MAYFMAASSRVLALTPAWPGLGLRCHLALKFFQLAPEPLDLSGGLLCPTLCLPSRFLGALPFLRGLAPSLLRLP
jgi:hypothetical protein